MDLTDPGLLTDLALLELEGSLLTDRGDHLVVRTPANPGYWWGNFLLVDGDADAAATRRWTRRFEAELPEALHRAIGFTGSVLDAPAWRAVGYESSVNVVLAATQIEEGAPPQGVEIRTLASADDWDQLATLGASDVVASTTTTAADLAERLLFEQRRAASRQELTARPDAVWFGAFEEGGLVGSLGIVVLGDLARYQDVVTLASARRRGIASALVRTAGRWALRHPDVRRLVIVAEEDGPAIGLYRRAGFAEVARNVQVQRAPGA